MAVLETIHSRWTVCPGCSSQLRNRISIFFWFHVFHQFWSLNVFRMNRPCMLLWKLSLIFICRVISLEAICVNHQLFVILKLQLSVAGTLQTDSTLWPRPFWANLTFWLENMSHWATPSVPPYCISAVKDASLLFSLAMSLAKCSLLDNSSVDDSP